MATSISRIDAATTTANFTLTGITSCDPGSVQLKRSTDGAGYTTVKTWSPAVNGSTYAEDHDYQANTWDFLVTYHNTDGSLVDSPVQRASGGGQTLSFNVGCHTNCVSTNVTALVQSGIYAGTAYWKKDGVMQSVKPIGSWSSASYIYSYNTCDHPALEWGFVALAYQPTYDTNSNDIHITFTPAETTTTTTAAGETPGSQTTTTTTTGSGGQPTPLNISATSLAGTNNIVNFSGVTNINTITAAGINANLAMEQQELNMLGQIDLDINRFHVDNTNWLIQSRQLMSVFTNQAGQVVQAFITQSNLDERLFVSYVTNENRMLSISTNFWGQMIPPLLNSSTQLNQISISLSNLIAISLTNALVFAQSNSITVNVTNNDYVTVETDETLEDRLAMAADSSAEGASQIDAMFLTIPGEGSVGEDGGEWGQITAGINGVAWTFNVNPFAQDWVNELAALCRAIITWLLYFGLFSVVLHTAQEVILAAQQVGKISMPPPSGVGSVVGKAFRAAYNWIKRGGVCLAVTVLMAAIIDTLYDWWIPQMFHLETSPYTTATSSWLRQALYMVDQFIPLSLLITIPLTGLALRLLFLKVGFIKINAARFLTG